MRLLGQLAPSAFRQQGTGREGSEGKREGCRERAGIRRRPHCACLRMCMLCRSSPEAMCMRGSKLCWSRPEPLCRWACCSLACGHLHTHHNPAQPLLASPVAIYTPIIALSSPCLPRPWPSTTHPSQPCPTPACLVYCPGYEALAVERRAANHVVRFARACKNMVRPRAQSPCTMHPPLRQSKKKGPFSRAKWATEHDSSH